MHSEASGSLEFPTLSLKTGSVTEPGGGGQTLLSSPTAVSDRAQEDSPGLSNGLWEFVLRSSQLCS